MWKNNTRQILEQRKFFNLLVILAGDQALLVITLQNQRIKETTVEHFGIQKEANQFIERKAEIINGKAKCKCNQRGTAIRTVHSTHMWKRLNVPVRIINPPTLYDTNMQHVDTATSF